MVSDRDGLCFERVGGGAVMPTRTVTGTILAADLTAYPGIPIRFYLAEPFIDLGVTYPRSEIEVVPNQTTGYFTTSLVVPTTPATALYRIRLIDDTEAWVYITEGAAVDIATLMTLSGSPIAQSALQTVMDVHEIKTDIHSISRTASLVVAASDAPALVKAQADYLCDGTNDEVQIQAAIDALPATGGKIQLSSGTFTVDYAATYTFAAEGYPAPYCVRISTQGPIELVGIRGSTIISFRAGAADVDMHMILVHGILGATRTARTTIRGITINGNDDVLEVIDVRHCKFIEVSDCDISGGTGGYGSVHILYNGGESVINNNRFAGVFGLGVENNNYIITNNIFDNAGVDGDLPMCWLAPDYDVIWGGGIPYTQYSSIVAGNVFIGNDNQLNLTGTRGCVVTGNTFSFQVGGHVPCLLINSSPVAAYAPGFDSVGNVVIGNTFTDIQWGVQLKGYSEVYGDCGCTGNIIANNTFNRDKDDHTYAYGVIEVGGTCDKNQIINNYFDPAGVTVLSKVGANTIVRGNIGYKTENSGTATIPNGQTHIDVTHGLAVTPTVDDITVTPTNIMGNATKFWISGVSATEFIITVDADPGAGTATFAWKAIVL